MEEKVETHPSYGMVAFHRIQGTPTYFFGSEIQGQGQYMCLEIKEGERHNDGYEDRYRGYKSLIRIRMTAAQFATLLTTMNIGDGVPCTIERIRKDGKSVGVKPPPPQKKEIERLTESFQNKISGIVQSLRDKQEQLEQILSQKTVKVKDRVTIRNIMESVMCQLEDNAPFMVQVFQESTEKIVVQAKAEVDAFVTTVALKTGFENLKLALGSHKEDDES